MELCEHQCSFVPACASLNTSFACSPWLLFCSCDLHCIASVSVLSPRAALCRGIMATRPVMRALLLLSALQGTFARDLFTKTVSINGMLPHPELTKEPFGS
jgi:hypothetical protein